MKYDGRAAMQAQGPMLQADRFLGPLQIMASRTFFFTFTTMDILRTTQSPNIVVPKHGCC